VRYPFVLFDVNETLLAPRESFAAVYASVLSALGWTCPVETLETALRESWDEMSGRVPAGADRYSHFPGGESEYWLRFASGAIERAGGDRALAGAAIGNLGEAFRDPRAWRVYPDAVPALERLRDAGARLAVVSNWDSRLPALLARLGLADYFDAVIVSHLAGVEKPSPAIFRKALAELGADAGAALHVGDLPDLDVAGARAAGIDAVLVDRRNRHPGHRDRIADLAPVPDLARSGRAEAAR
jgi:putative hydrolase of the HAD superfamily